MGEEIFDCIIIGGGPAGCSAGIYAARFGLKTMMVCSPETLSQAEHAADIENYPGFRKIAGTELIAKMREQAAASGVKIVESKATSIVDGKLKTVHTEGEKYSGKSVIIATGAAHRKGGVPGEEEFAGKGVSYCAPCDGPLFKGKPVIVWGGGDSALSYAVYLQSIGCKVTLVHRRNEFRAAAAVIEQARKSGVKFVLERTVTEIKGKKFVESVILDDKSVIKASAVFIAIGEVPAVELARSAGVTVDASGFIPVDVTKATNVKGIFAAGDVTATPFRQIATATGDGTIAALSAFKFVRGG